MCIFDSNDGLGTNHQIGEIGGHCTTGAEWKTLTGGWFRIEYGAWNARLVKQSRTSWLTLNITGMDTISEPIYDYLYDISANAYIGEPVVVELQAGDTVDFSQTPNIDWVGFMLTITQIDPNAGQLTISTNPGYVTTVQPYCNATQNVPVGLSVSIDAQKFVNCGNDGEVLVFDYWEEVSNVSVADVNDQQTTVKVLADGTAEVKAHYVDGRQCGDECHPVIAVDLVPDCIIDFKDFAEFGIEWLTDNSVQP
jgi:hypothetical protein